jgi:hypothetical protein
MTSAKERTERYRFNQYLILDNPNFPFGHLRPSSQQMNATSRQQSPSRGDSQPFQSDFNDQKDHLIGLLRNDLKAAEEEIEDLEMELVHVMKEKDKSPGALLFFSIMEDPAFVPNLQQLIIQFKHLRQFLDYSENMDYVTLRKRLQVCLVIMPSIDKLIEKYGRLYQQWSTFRLNWFAERKVRGSAADGMAYCPLCYNDITEPSEGHHLATASPQKRSAITNKTSARRPIKNHT